MSSLFSSFGYCFWWFLAGILVGWLLTKCISKCCRKPAVSEPPKSPATEPAKLAEKPPAKPAAKVAPAAKAATPAATAIDLAAAKKAGFTIKNANDLTVIEGIGPKINALFHDNGIKTFAQLAAAAVPQMRAILDKGGARFRIANPSTWAQQAALAAENKWPELKKLQDKLSAGVKK